MISQNRYRYQLSIVLNDCYVIFSVKWGKIIYTANGILELEHCSQ